MARDEVAEVVRGAGVAAFAWAPVSFFSKERPVSAQSLAVEEAKAIVAGFERAAGNAATAQSKQIAPNLAVGNHAADSISVANTAI